MDDYQAAGDHDGTPGPDPAPPEGATLIRAADLCAAHIGAEAWLPGRFERHVAAEDGADPWRTIHTWAPITMITLKKDGTIKVRRHPDSHVDHTLDPDHLIPVRHQPRPSALDDALRREENLREELEDAWAKAVAAAEPGARITEGKMPPFIPADWLRAILDDSREDLYEIATVNGRLPAAEAQSVVLDVILHHDWAAAGAANLTAAHGTHRYDGRCAVCRGHWEQVALQITFRLADLA